MGTKSAALYLMRTRCLLSARDRKGRGRRMQLGRRDTNGLTERLKAQVMGGGRERGKKEEEKGKREGERREKMCA